MTARGAFITLEGIDGAGKSSHIPALVMFLNGQGIKVVSTREPGGTPLGEQLRNVLLHNPMHLDTEALLMFAARREHLATVIDPALARGDWVVCDRFTDASFAYQGGGRGLPFARLAALETWINTSPEHTVPCQPDMTLLFDLPIDTAAQRLQQDARALDRFEREGQDFHARVRAAYLARAQAEAGRFRIIDSQLAPDAARALVLQHAEALLHRMSARS